MTTPQCPSKTKARAQRELWIDARNAGWIPPLDTSERTLERWRTGQRFIPFAVLYDMVQRVRDNGTGSCENPHYYAKPRLPAKEATDA